ncbi:PREDICTED: otoconin-90 [Gavialis gangeticus]|uniref:otoconin-90 n=1 Tax=Gavialis gangeticus TaxID=94835 RepID=UPI00092FBDD1|nr:PREDICTED: otoconin-90 [Gavialis gangeticus]
MCLHTNARSLGKKQEELVLLLNKKDYDLIGITETWWDSTYDCAAGAQELEPTPRLPELPHAAERNLNNITFFNGVFQNVESVTLFFDCLGSHFTWLQSIFTNFPALLNFVNKMKCVTGLCPRDFEDYGCSCRFEMEGLPVDETDSCCFQHRKCYEEAVEMECMWDPAKISTDFSCLTKNLTCRSGDPCEQLLCNCDKAAIECFVHSRINSSLNGLDVSFCPTLVTELLHHRNDKTLLATTSMEEVTSSRPNHIDVRTTRAGVTSPEPDDVVLRTPQAGVIAREQESTTATLTEPTQKVTTVKATDTALDTNKGFMEPAFTVEGTTRAPADTHSANSKERPTENAPARTANKDTVLKIGGEGTVYSTVSPEVSPSDGELNSYVGKVCDRFTFLQIRGNGKVKQELPQLGEMLYCLTDRCPQEFESYGCYCGQEGRGSPADVLDRCCFSHHCCMEQVRKLGCHPERILRSEVVCFDHKPKCIGWSMCEKLLCSCDQTAAECMAAAVFNDSLKVPSQQDCQGEKALCWSGTHERPSSGSGIGTRASSSEESSEEAGPRSVLRRVKRGARFSFGKDYSAPLHGR